MKFFQEITSGDLYPNHVYLLSDTREFMYGYVPQGTGQLTQFKSRYQFGVKGRKFREVANTFGYAEAPLLVTQNRWEVQGSGGNRYVIERVAGQLTCTCNGFTFRGKCKHTQVVA